MYLLINKKTFEITKFSCLESVRYVLYEGVSAGVFILINTTIECYLTENLIWVSPEDMNIVETVKTLEISKNIGKLKL